MSDDALVATLKLPPVWADNSLNSRNAVACSSAGIAKPTISTWIPRFD